MTCYSLMVKQYTCEATTVPLTALDDGGASTSQQMTNLRRIKVVEYSYMILSLVSPWPSFQFLPIVLIQVEVHSFLIESP